MMLRPIEFYATGEWPTRSQFQDRSLHDSFKRSRVGSKLLVIVVGEQVLSYLIGEGNQSKITLKQACRKQALPLEPFNRNESVIFVRLIYTPTPNRTRN